MIVYFADRYMNVLGLASAELPGGLTLYDDEKVEDVETGVASFSCDLTFEDEQRREVEEMTKAGNYLLRRHDGANEFYTIIDSEIDPLDHTANVYAEDAGLDLLNEIAEAYEATEAHNIAWYIDKWTEDSGFEIGINEIPDLTRTLKWDSEATVTERIDSIATQFDNAEVTYSFDIEGLTITNKYINIYKKRGGDNGATLRVNHDLNNITIKRSVANLATALKVTGGTPEGKDTEITLSGYKYDDGDMYVDGEYLKSRNALAKWSRYCWEQKIPGYEGHIVKTYSYDTTEQSALCAHAVTELKSVCDMETNYEVELATLPDNVRIGDTVNLVDENGELYVSARLLELKTSITNQTHEATFGDYLIKDSGISSKVEQLASQFAELAKNRTFYTWIVYADDESGTGISTDSTGKAYVGIAANRTTIDPDISDPTIYKWSKVEGSAGRSLESITEHYLVSNLSEGVTKDAKGWVTSPIPAMTSESKYLWNYETLNYSDGTSEDLEPKIIGAFGDTGSKSPAIVEMTEQYYLSTSNTELAGGEWVRTMPTWTSGTYLWTRWCIEWDEPNPTTLTYSEPVLATSFNEIHEAADKANTAATEAKEKAESATTTATKAAAEVEEANKQIDALTTNLETVKSDLTTNYATKGELTEVNTTLGTQISQNAADIESTATKVQTVETNANEALADAAAAQQAADDAASAAADAQTKYTALQEQADATDEQLTAAKTAVEKAQADATAAADAAAAAQSAANSLTDRVTTAETKIAQNAEDITLRATKTEVQTAQDTADAAQSDLDTAKANLAAVTSRVDATEEDIAAAQTAVANAQTAADTAKANAATAQTAAEAAQSTADTANAAAAKAQEDAEAAQSTANSAVTNAATAQKAAEDAATAAEAAQTTADTAATAAATAQTKADEAATAATAAQTTADTAKANAATAQSTADTAKANAATAQAKADEAATAASTAQGVADTAKANAATAQSAADAAQADLNTAKENLAAVTSRVDATEEEITAAQEAVTAAQSTADTAKANAAAAQTAAEAAQSTADTAKTNAETAQSTADTAKANAKTAQDTADAAQADATAAQNTATAAKTAAETAQSTADTAKTNAETAKANAEAAQAAADAAQENLDNLKIGGRNLALESNAQQGGASNPIAVYDVSEPLVAGTEYTCQINLVPAEGVTDIKLYLSNGGQLVATFTVSGTDEQTLAATFSAKYASGKTPDDDAENAKLKFYRYPTTITDGTIVNWAKVETGSKATDWTPAPEDMATGSDLSTAVESITTNIAEITTTTDSIEARVSEQETVTSSLETRTSSLETSITQTNESVETRFTTLEQTITAQGSEISKTETLIRETSAGIEIGKTDSPNKMQIDNDSLDFLLNGEKVAEYASDGLTTKSVTADTQIKLDSQWALRFGSSNTDGSNLNIVWIGG